MLVKDLTPEVDASTGKVTVAVGAVLAAYNELVPQFEALFDQQGRDFARFYATVKGLAALPKHQRRARLANPV